MLKKTSTRFIHEAWGGVKCTTSRGFCSSQVLFDPGIDGGEVGT